LPLCDGVTVDDNSDVDASDDDNGNDGRDSLDNDDDDDDDDGGDGDDDDDDEFAISRTRCGPRFYETTGFVWRQIF
jgi:hypothetical protein